MNPKKFVEVYTTFGELQAQVIRSKLEASGIPSIFQNEALGTLGFIMDGLGQFHILVAEQDEQAAREVLSDTE
jgi:Putative prokaryotic signal transducing protein